MSGSTAYDLRCPTCAAHVAAGAYWCTLCYTDLRPKPETGPAVGSTPEPAPPASVQELVLVEDGTEAEVPHRRAGKHARPAAQSGTAAQGGTAARDVPLDATPAVDVEVIAAQMLAQLAASQTAAPLGRFSGLVESPAKKAAVMVGGAGLAMTLLFGLMAVLGALL